MTELLYPGPEPRRREPDEMTLKELGERLLRHRVLILGITLAVVLGVAVWTFLATPRYRSTAVVRLLDQDSEFGLLAEMSSLEDLELPALGGRPDLETEIGVLRSARITQAVVDSLGLRISLPKPAARRTELIRVLSVGPPETGGSLTLRHRSDGVYDVESDGFDPPAALPERIRAGEALRFAGFAVELDVPPEEHPEEIRIEVLPEYRALRRLREELRIQRQEGGSRLVEVSYDSPDRHLAAAVVNALVREYLSYKRTTERGEIRSTAEELREQVATHGVQLADAEEALREFQRRYRVLAPEEEAEQQVARVAELQMAIDQLRVERSAVADLLDLVESRAEAGAGTSVYRQLATLPSLISNGAIQDMLQTLVSLENERSELLARRQQDNADVRVLESRIEELESQLHRLASSYLESLDGQLGSARRELDRIMSELEAMPGLKMEYLRLLRERTVQEETYLTLVAQLKQAEVQEAIQDERVRVVDLGRISHPDDPVFPKPAVNLFLALLLGLTLGMGTALARDLWDDRVHSREEAEAAAGGLPLVATLPALPRSEGLMRNGRLLPGVGRRDVLERRGRVGIDRDPWSPAAEAYRGLAADLALSNGASEPRVFALTSSHEGEGKTTVATNLAVALAQQGLRTLLVDGEIREGRIHRMFGVETAPGLAQILTGRASVADVVTTVELAGSARTLDLIPAGDPPDRPLDLMRLETLDELLAEFRRSYERVVMNVPAMDRGSEAVAFGTRADAVVLIALQGVTEREALERAAERLRTAGTRGFLLMVNEADDRALGS